jgi:hypothetical protein
MLFVVLFARVMLFVVAHCLFSFTLEIHRYKKQLTRQMRPDSINSATL